MDTQQLKEMLGYRAKDIILAGIGTQENRSHKISCVFHNEKTPSMGWFEEGLCFNCLGCGENLDIFRYYMEWESCSFQEAKVKVADLLGIDLDIPSTLNAKKKYKVPQDKFNELGPQTIKMATDRGILKSTLEECGVQTIYKGKDEWLVFKHLNSKRKHIFNTYRKATEKKCSREKDSKPILWGVDTLDPKKPVIITEGQFDRMVVHQCGYTNVVSVPSGIKENAWIENSWALIEKVDKFIIWSDSDQAGLDGAEEIRSRIGKDKVIVDYHDECKDANDLLMQHGPEAVKEFIDNLLAERTEGLVNMGRRKRKGQSNTEFYTGFNEIDRHFKKFKGGQLTLLFGRDNEGKSTVMSQMIANILESQKVFLYSGELSDDNIEDWIMRQVAGFEKGLFDKTFDEWGDAVFSIKKDIKKAILTWYRDMFYVYEKKVDVTGDSGLFKVMELAYRRHGVKFFVIDNLMSAIEDTNGEENAQQTNFVKRCKAFALTHDVQVVLVAHPNKSGSIEGVPLEKVHVAGSKNITNIADNILGIERVWDITEEEVEVDSNGVPYTGIIRALKDRVTAGRKNFYFHFDKTSLRFHSEETPAKVEYGWKYYLPKVVTYNNGTTQTFKKGEMGEAIK